MVNRQVATTSAWIIVTLFGLAFVTFRPLARPLPKAQGNTAPAAGSSVKVDFQRGIQPIFAQNCYRCHGPAQQMSGLRLDSKQAAFAGGLQGKVIVPGKGSESTLYKRVAGIGDQARMPLGGKPLDPAQVQLIRTWIDEGAEWTDTAEAKTSQPLNHWAFIPPKLPAVPKVNNRTWAKNPIDAFVLARLEKEGLSPSPEADRTTLLRRLSLDLIGLPPTPEEVDAFLADKSKNAYEKQVDRLLKSAHYGEKWGRQWLDAARYADSNGFEKDMPRNVWFYRDWVINALNRDLPYNRFVLEQIAGDMLPGATQDQIVATGFLRNSMLNEEGGIDPEQFRMEAMFDRMDAIGKGILGITIQCAQCHNHKYDPLKQEEYYRIFAFLNDCDEAKVAAYTPQEQMKRAEVFRKTRELEADLQHQNPDWQERMAAWEEQVKGGQPEWVVVRPEVDDISTGGERLLPLKDGSFLKQGYAPNQQKLKLTVKTDVQNIAAFRLELLTDANLPMGGPGRSTKGTCALTEFEVEAASADAPDKSTKIKIAKATADVSPTESPLEPMFNDKSGKRRVTGPIDFALDGKDDTAWGIDVGPGLRNQSRKAVFAVQTPISNSKGTVLTFYLTQHHDWSGDFNQTNIFGRFRLSITTTPGATADPLPSKVRQVLSIPRDKRTSAQVQTVFAYWRTTVPEWKAANEQIATLWRQYPQGSSQLVLSERGDPRQTHILTRGDFLKPEKAVTPGAPAFLHPLPHDASWENGQPTRLTFAEWLVDRNSPTTARSIVNRIWQSYFGIGIVSTSENFGTQSEPPSHPELLDWLATTFMDHGWSRKALHRLIVTSATYRQSSNVTPEMHERDPYNRLLARGPRFRVDGEIVRDIALAASGLLNDKVGGPSVFPPAPELLFVPPSSFSKKSWDESNSQGRYRRAVYTFRYRSVPYPALQVFDAPNGDASCVRRGRSNTPLQALTTLNEPLFLECARALAARALVHGAGDEQRLQYAFRRCLSRRPSPQEANDLLGLLHKETHRFEDGTLDPWDLLGASAAMSPLLPKSLTPAQLAGWTAVSRVLLNVDETITKE
jgi:mono/diheme cytochrome c family protein